MEILKNRGPSPPKSLKIRFLLLWHIFYFLLDQHALKEFEGKVICISLKPKRVERDRNDT